MKTPLEIVNDISIASPCPVAWEEMSGDAQVRHCWTCNRHVYNVSCMTAAEAVELIKEKEGNLCVHLYRRADGTVLTSDCPEGLRLKQQLSGLKQRDQDKFDETYGTLNETQPPEWRVADVDWKGLDKLKKELDKSKPPTDDYKRFGGRL